MVKIFLCGPGGSGKTTLVHAFKKQLKVKDEFHNIAEVARKLMKKKKLKSEDVKTYNLEQFIQFQEDILVEQSCTEQDTCEAYTNIISDRCILDCLAYALWKMNETEMNRKKKLDELCKKHQVVISASVLRYQSSLIVLVHQWNKKHRSVEDGTRLSMSPEESNCYLEIFKELLKHFKLGYVDMVESVLDDRLKTLLSAREGKINRESYTLKYYQDLSDKKKRNGRNKSVENCDHSTNISFYMNHGNSHVLRSIKITEDHIELSSTKVSEKCGRIFVGRNINDFFCIDFDKKFRSIDVQKVLLNKIYVNGDLYSFLGCSQSGLKDRKAILSKGTTLQAKEILKKYGSFDEIPSVSKRMARISLLFSAVELTDIEIPSNKIVDVDDILSKNKKYNFTDGCGAIGMNLSRDIYSKLSDKDKPVDYEPSVYQLRLQGIKGVVAIDPTIHVNTIHVRPSMTKFSTTSLPLLGICNYSKPYSYGHLNRQLVYLLSALGVQDETFLEIQQEYFQLIENMYTCVESALTMLYWNNKFDTATMVMRLSNQNQVDDTHHKVLKYVRKELNSIEQNYLTKDEKKKVNGIPKQKLRIIIRESRFIFGVCDQSNKLRYGQCYVRLTVNNAPKTITGKILTARMPCYLLGDLRVLEAVDIPELSHLVDCVVFPTQGRRPHADEQAGGDLDGDQFFVTWDARIIPPKTVESCEYPAADERKDGTVTIEKMIRHFSIQNQAMKTTGLLANLYEQWADTKGPSSNECECLGQLFGRAIDALKSGEQVSIPKRLREIPELVENQKFVWQKMEERARIFKADRKTSHVKYLQSLAGISANDITEEFVHSILTDQFCSLSEYRKFDFLWRFALNKHTDHLEAIDYIKQSLLDQINFSLFSSTEQMIAMDVGVSPILVGNALCKGKVLALDDLKAYGMLQERSNWGLLFQSDHCEFHLSDLIEQLMYKDKILICFKLPDNVRIALQIRTQLHQGVEHTLLKGDFTAMFISRDYQYHEKFTPAYDLYYDLVEDRFQIYKNKDTRQTFLWFKSPAVSGQNLNDGSIRIDYRQDNDIGETVSCDLTSFPGNFVREGHPLIRKTPISEIEVFASIKDIPAYPDVIIGNQMERVPGEELECEKSEPEEPDTRDVCKILLDKLGMVKADNAKRVKVVLEELVACCVPWTVDKTDETQNALGILLSNINMDSLSWKDRLEFAVSLIRLGDQNIARTILLESICKTAITTAEFVEILGGTGKWSHVWYIAPDVLYEFVELIKTTLLSNIDVLEKEKYVIEIAWNSFVEFTNEITLCKENLRLNAITNLMLESTIKEDDVRDEDSETVLYRPSGYFKASIIPSVGDHVVLMREKDLDTRAVTAIAKVNNCSSFPFSIELKLLDEIKPSIISDTKDGINCRWMIAQLEEANITLYTRVMKACMTLLLDQSERRVFDAICSVLQSSVQTQRGENVDAENHPNYLTNKEITTPMKELNSAQQKSVIAALSNSLTLIHGPPGTGKTKVACAILQQAVRMFHSNPNNPNSQKKGILAVAETNTAVDNITRRLLDIGINVVRVGNNKFIPRNLFHVTLEGKLRLENEKHAEKIDFRSTSGQMMLKKNLVKRVLNAADVVLTTCAGAGDSALTDRCYEFVLVDEATQTKEGTLLCALAHRAKQLVMIGDPLQLGPLVKLEKDWNWLTKEAFEVVSNSLKNSFFHRLKESNNIGAHFLDTQYRMHPKIAQFPSQTFYGGKLKSGTTHESRKPIWKFIQEPAAFLSVDGNEKKCGTSFANYEEVDKIEQIVNVLLKTRDIARENIAVLALYKGQVNVLRTRLGDIEVNSIDGFQGREAEIVLVSTVRSRMNLGYSDDRRRLNVLLTRAKRGLLVVGHSTTLETSDIWKNWIKSVPRLEDHLFNKSCR